MASLAKSLAKSLSGRLHYAWVVVAIGFLLQLTAAGVRSMPGILITPLQSDLGWDRGTISLAVAVGIALYGLVGPFAAAVMQRYGIRRTVLGASLLLSLSVASTTLVVAPWQMMLTWGILSGIGTGVLAQVLGATISGRWFRSRRGLVMGLMTAAGATGQLVFLPALAVLIEHSGWRAATLVVAGVAAVMIPLVWFLLPERPSSLGLRPYGLDGPLDPADDVVPHGNPIVKAFTTLGRAIHSPTFWLLFSSFFICGLSTNGLVGTHLIAFCQDHGISEVRGALLLAAMGVFDLVGTTASGWLTDRYSKRLLLAWYYGLRGLALVVLPFSDFSLTELTVFAVFYGLDWIATVPPTVRLAAEVFGEADAPIVYGWVAAGHQLGAATAAFGAGLTRSAFDTYLPAFVLAGTACIAIAFVLVGAASNHAKLTPVTP